MPHRVLKIYFFVYSRWWPFFTVLFYLASPIPTMISKRQNYDNSSCLELSIFITVGIILSSFALPIVLCLAGTIAVGACVFNILGNIVVYFTLFGFFLGNFKPKTSELLLNNISTFFLFSIPRRSWMADLSAEKILYQIITCN